MATEKAKTTATAKPEAVAITKIYRSEERR